MPELPNQLIARLLKCYTAIREMRPAPVYHISELEFSREQFQLTHRRLKRCYALLGKHIVNVMIV